MTKSQNGRGFSRRVYGLSSTGAVMREGAHIDAKTRELRLRKFEEMIAHADREHSPQECAEALAALQIDPLAMQRALDLESGA